MDDLVSITEWVLEQYGSTGAKGDSFYDVIHRFRTQHLVRILLTSSSNTAYDSIDCPARLLTRYLWEDIPDGLLSAIDLGAISFLIQG